jgi:Kef-type K+ transport system membrane component KefB
VSQVEAEIKPFKGVLLGLFFLCTGASVDVDVLIARFPIIALLTVGLISVKFTITSIAARLFGLSEGESIKVGLTLSQGGEFAFVLLALAQELHILPTDLNALLICVVVASMALTPLLADWGDYLETRDAQVWLQGSLFTCFAQAT